MGAAFGAWLDRFLAAYYRHRPVNATFTGIHDYDDRLPDYSASGVDETVAAMDALRRELRALPQEPLTESEQTDRRLAAGYLEIQRWEFESSHFHRANPCVYTGEAVFGAIALLLRPFAPLADRLERAAARLSAVPALLADGRRNIERAPGAWIERALRECAGARELLGDGIDRLIRETGGAAPGLRAAADRASAAFAEFARHLATELAPRATDAYACGDAALGLLLREGHFLDEDADEIARYAEDELASGERALAEAAGRFGARTAGEALAQLLDRHPAADAYYARFAEVWAQAREHAVAHDLVTWPEYPLRYVPQPPWARAAAPSLYFLAYRSPAPFDGAPVVEYLVPPIDPAMPADEQARRLRAANDSVIKLNHVIHHGGLGHHIQNWHAQRASSQIGRIAAVDCASRIGLFCGGTMAEGWACYATDLMDETGFLEPLEQYARRHTRLRQAARALVDVRLHQGRFSLADAVACYRDRAGMPLAAARAEAVKNSMFPGAALMYLVGTDAIHALRKELAPRPGFALRAFHDRLLSHGSIPVALIRERMLRESPPAPRQ